MPYTPEQLFAFMAGPRLARVEFTPVQTERQVQEYVSRLQDRIADAAYHPAGSVDALVFGEWGHGKSQVLYRTVDAVAGTAGVVAVRIIPERLAADDLLRGAARSLAEAGHGTAGEQLLQAAEEVLHFEEGSYEQLRDAAAAIARVAGEMQARHFVLLLDEAAQMGGFNLQAFLRELSAAFREIQVQLHTLQCHSLATLDRAREIAQDLGEWLQKATQIHLPSIRAEDSAAFFSSRVRTVTQDAELATRLIPSGVARAICEVAGGNPRLMLQYARSVYGVALADGRDGCNGGDVVKAFAAIPAGHGGVLFSNQELKKVCQLLPQEWGEERGRRFARYLESRIGALYGECDRVAAQVLATACEISVAELQRFVSKTVTGIPVFDSYRDEVFEDDTKYGLSRELRSRLSSATASTGTIDQKRHQVELIVGPHRHQGDLTAGFARMLRAKGFALTVRYRPLGSCKVEGAAPITLGSQILDVPLPDSAHTVKCLVVALYRWSPPMELVAAIGEVFAKKQCDFVVFCHRHEDGLTWDDWISGEGGDELKRLLGARQVCVLHMDPADDGDWGGHLEPDADALARGVTFYANVLAAQQQHAGFSEEVDQAADAVATAFERIRPTLKDVCHLPTSEEQRLLESAIWENGATCTLKDLKERFPTFGSGSMLRELLPEYLEVVAGKRYQRTVPANWRLWRRVRECLESCAGASVEDVTRHTQGNEVLVGGAGGVRAAIDWVLGMMKTKGQAEEDEGSWRYIDVEKARADAAKACRDRIDRGVDLRRMLIGFDHGDSARPELQAFGDVAARVDGCTELQQFLELRDSLTTSVQALELAVKRARESCDQVLTFLEGELAKLDARIRPVPGSVAAFLDLQGQRDEVGELVREARRNSADGLLAKVEVDALSRRVQQNVRHLEDWFGEEAQPAASPTDQILMAVLKRPGFARLTIRYDEPTTEAL